MKITVFTLPTCPKCNMIKSKLKQKNIPFEECQDINRMQELGIRSAPTMMVDEKLMINLNEINTFVNGL